MTSIDHPAGGNRTLWAMIKSCSGTQTDRRNSYRFVLWTAIWGAAFIGASFGLSDRFELEGPQAWALVLLPIVLGIPPLLAYLHMLRETDELLRRIQLEALALGFGTGLLFGLCDVMLEMVGVPAYDPAITVAAMMIAWAAGQVIGMYRYR